MIILSLLPSLKPFHMDLVSIKECIQCTPNEVAFLKGLGKKQTPTNEKIPFQLILDHQFLYRWQNFSCGLNQVFEFSGARGISKRILAYQPNYASFPPQQPHTPCWTCWRLRVRLYIEENKQQSHPQEPQSWHRRVCSEVSGRDTALWC